jgi:hypothetical protein
MGGIGGSVIDVSGGAAARLRGGSDFGWAVGARG